MIKKAYKIYKKDNSKELASEFIKKHHTMWTKVHFIGVFDTVAALKGKSDYHNFKLSNSVVHGRHAISIDETRVPFEPVLWDKNIAEDQTMKQVHFLGVHTDVGGGYEKSGLSDISLEWMLNEAKDLGLKTYKESRTLRSPNPDGFMHREKYIVKPIKYKFRPRSWDEGKNGKLVIHKTALERTIAQDNEGRPYRSWVLDKSPIIDG